MKNLSEVKDQYIKPGLKVYNKNLGQKGEIALKGAHPKFNEELVIVVRYGNDTISAELKSQSSHIDVAEQ